MWTQAKSNRIIYEREKVKDHVMHIERLRKIQPVIAINKPRKPSHLKTNAKREMQNLGKYTHRVRLGAKTGSDRPSIRLFSPASVKLHSLDKMLTNASQRIA